MKALISIIFIGLIISCKPEKRKTTIKNKLSVAEKIAGAHGFANWKNVSEVSFTFFGRRQWIWHPKTEAVTLIRENDTIHYNRKLIDSLNLQVDAAFINDKFWLLIPFQLIWDQNATLSNDVKEEAPISNKPLNKITISYPNEGGYTPGDAYDIFYGDDYVIKEWIFRKGNQEKPSMITTFENYQNFKGIRIALDHKKADGNWNLNFTNVNIK